MDEMKTSKIEFVLSASRPDIGNTRTTKKNIADVSSDNSSKTKKKKTMQSLANRIMRVSELVIPDTMIKTIMAIPKIIGPVITIFAAVILGILAQNAFVKLVSGWFDKEQKDASVSVLELGDEFTKSLTDERGPNIGDGSGGIGEEVRESVVLDISVGGQDILADMENLASKEVAVNAKYNIDTSSVTRAEEDIKNKDFFSPLIGVTKELVTSYSKEATAIITNLIPAYTSLGKVLFDVLSNMHQLNTGEALAAPPEYVSSPVIQNHNPVEHLIDTDAVTWNNKDPTSRIPNSTQQTDQ